MVGVQHTLLRMDLTLARIPIWMIFQSLAVFTEIPPRFLSQFPYSRFPQDSCLSFPFTSALSLGITIFCEVSTFISMSDFESVISILRLVALDFSSWTSSSLVSGWELPDPNFASPPWTSSPSHLYSVSLPWFSSSLSSFPSSFTLQSVDTNPYNSVSGTGTYYPLLWHL